jgi:predicted acetyltransferase
METLALVAPSLAHAAQLEAYKNEFLANGEPVAGGAGLEQAISIEAWLQTVADNKREETVQEGRVPATTLLAIRTGDYRLVGMVDIRYRLNDWLLQYGGHIGYSVRLSERCQGYATTMLRQALDHCRRMGIMRVLVTCDSENIASARTILNNGGALENEIPDGNRVKQRYWIDLG